MKSYQKRYHGGGSADLYDIPPGNDGLMAHIDECIAKCDMAFRIGAYLALNHMAYSMLCSWVSSKADCDSIQHQTTYKGLDIVVISVPGHENHKYSAHVFGVFPKPDAHDFFRSLNQEQFQEKRKK